MIAVEYVSNADYYLLYRNDGSTPRYFNDEDRPTEPRKKVDHKSFQRVQERFTSGNYDGIAVVKDGKVVEHLPGGEPPAPVVHHDALARVPTPPPVQTTSASNDAVLVAQADAGAVAQFTCLRYDQTIGKLFYFDSDGKLQRHTVASGENSTADIVSCATIGDLEEAFRSAKATDIFVGGLPPSNGVRVTSKAKRGEGKIARSKDDFVFCAGPGVMFIDNDHPVGEGDNQFEVYVRVVPALTFASYVYAPSSSAFIVNAETGEILKGAGGQHYAIPVQDASDIPRALKALHQRMVLAEYGKAIVSKAGTAHIRSQVDEALRTPNQPLFQRVSLAPGLVQHKEAHIGSHRGESFLFDTRSIPDLNHEELARLTAIEKKLREGVADEVNDKRGAWIEAKVQKVAESNSVEREVAAQYLRVILTNGGPTKRFDLIPGIQIRFSSGLVDVRELLANPGKYDGKPCADPFETDYGSGIGVAKFYENAKTGKPTINSNAHGGQIFFLHHDPKEIDLGGILNQGAKKHDADPAQAGGPSDAGTSNPMSNWRPEPATVQPTQQKATEAPPEVWPEPVDPFVEHAAPQFPVDHLPEALGKYCHEVSAGSGFDAGGYAFALLVAAANLIDHRARLSIGPLSVPPVLWGGIVAPAGRGKSPVMGAAIKFAKKIDDDLVHASLQEREAFLKSVVGMKQKEMEALDQPPWKQLIASDTTIEALGALLKDNPTGLLLAYDELSEFVGRMDAYNGGTGKDRGTYLQAYDGGSKTINRKSSILPLVVENFSVGVLAGVQPEKLAEMFKRAGGADGLFQRFIVYALPQPGDVNYAVSLGTFTETNCGQVFERLHEWSRSGVISRLTVDAAVLPLMQNYHRQIRIIAQRTALNRLAEHYDKFPGFLARILFALHCIECAAKGRFSAVVTVETFNRAHAIANVLYRHSEAIYNDFGQHDGGSTKLLKSACEAVLSKGWAQFKWGDLTRNATGWQDADDRQAQGAIQLLIEFDWVREVMPEKVPGRPGRRSVGIFEVNPLVSKRFVEQSQRIVNERAERHAAIQAVATKRRALPWQ